MPTHRTHRFVHPTRRILGLALLMSCTPSPRAARAPAPTPAECEAIEAKLLARSGYRPGANLDSLRAADLDSAVVRFRERRRPATDTAERMDRAPKLLHPESIQHWLTLYYPPTLLRQGIGGSTRLVFFVRPDSTPAMFRVLHSSGWSELDLASVHVMEQATVAPGMYHGCPVWTMIAMPVTWVPRAPRRP
jgi:outer membrane biosynthesis protein TonB